MIATDAPKPEIATFGVGEIVAADRGGRDTEVEIIDDVEMTLDVMFKLSQQRGDVDAAQEDAVKTGMRKTADKRVVMKFSPGKIVSWDHSKLGGVY